MISAQTSDIVLGAALVTAHPGYAQRKVPLLLARSGPVLVSWTCGQPRLPLQGPVCRVPGGSVKSQEVGQGERGGGS